VNDEGDMVGILSFSDIREVASEDGLEHLVVANDMATKDVVTLSPNHNLNEAMEKFAGSSWVPPISRLPVAICRLTDCKRRVAVMCCVIAVSNVIGISVNLARP
jgi:hypothetical protein